MKLPKRLLTILTRISCLHLWKKTGALLDIMYGKGYLWEYKCSECGKVISRWTGEEPISGILPPNPWEIYKKDPLNTMSPPIIRSDD